jgi:hypothetical protein
MARLTGDTNPTAKLGAFVAEEPGDELRHLLTWREIARRLGLERDCGARGLEIARQ